MGDPVYKKVDVVGTSATSISDAINSAIATASEQFDQLGWFEVHEIRGQIRDGAVAQYQVGVKIGYRLDT